jgi:MFS family permease
MASRRAINSMLCLAQSSIGAGIVSIGFALLMIGSIGSIYLAGRIAERRGRRFIIWAWIAAVIGPLALPLVFLFPNLHGNGNHA